VNLDAGSRVVVRTAWTNDGTAPTYDAWDVRLTLRAATGGSVTRSLGQPLRGLVGSRTRRATLDTSGLAKGTYDVFLGVVDPSGYAAPMRLANSGRTSRGTYRVGTVGVR